MKDLRAFDIDTIQLSDKKHAFSFAGDDSFFALFPNSLVQHGQFTAQLTLDKSATMMQLAFDIQGTVQLTCDRTLELFNEPIATRQRIILKYGEEPGELTDEIEIIAHDTFRINVAQYLYEFIGLALPLKKLHPRLRDATPEIETDDAILVYSSAPASDQTDAADPDPRWAALKGLQ